MPAMAITDYIWCFLKFQNSNVLIVQYFPDVLCSSTCTNRDLLFMNLTDLDFRATTSAHLHQRRFAEVSRVFAMVDNVDPRCFEWYIKIKISSKCTIKKSPKEIPVMKCLNRLQVKPNIIALTITLQDKH